MTNKDELIGKYVGEIYKRLDEMSQDFVKMSLADRKHMENGFRYAVTASVEIISKLLTSEVSLPKVTEIPKGGDGKPINKFADGMSRFSKDAVKFITG